MRATAAGVPDLRARADAAAQAVIADLLARLRPEDAVLSEEALDDPARLEARRVWIVDPLDGTREYGEEGRHDWAVHVALWQDGELTDGAVALPALGAKGLVLATDDVTAPPARAAGAAPRLAVSRSRATDLVKGVAEVLGAELVPMGSAGFKASAVVRGEADAYVHTGGQYEWDSAAPVAVARAAGLHTSRVDGSPLAYNRPDPSLPDLVVCRPELAEAVLAAIASLSGGDTATGRKD
nr:inositol monophosphatase family protein [Motilibacter aurantiacus]